MKKILTSDDEQKIYEDMSKLGGGITDVKINDTSIVENGVANIPEGGYDKLGLLKVYKSDIESGISTGYLGLRLVNYENHIKTRNYNLAITNKNYDLAVKSALCDGKGEAYTPQEQASARSRLGIDVWEEVCDITLEEDVARIDIDFEYPCREIYVYLSQENCETKITGSWVVYPKLINDESELGAYIKDINATYHDGFIHCINHGNMWIERLSGAINPQKNTTTVNITGKVVDRVFNQKIVNKEDLNFYGFKSQTTVNKGIRIRILGVKA